MRNLILATWMFAAGPAMLPTATHCVTAQESVADDKPASPSTETRLIRNARQLTFEGKRSGEGYFNHDGSLLVFQSERLDSNPFYQIYLMNLETGDIENISPGHGKTTCAWIHPDDNRVLFASTQDDREAYAKQKAELEFRESGETRRYSWDYDPNYELYAFDRTAKTYRQLTEAEGYDAEGSYSPDGDLIAFASNRSAFERILSEEEQQQFENDPSIEMEIFLANADGSDVRRLTETRGYDGGPFFSPDGKRICWRRFSENGLTAEIFTMKINGDDQKQLTKMNAMSWAPFYHPSGKYLIFTTNRHGFGNFELYLVDADGKSQPVRVTETDGFDGLASFSPDGKKLTWTSNRNAQKQSQIYLADWNHERALELLGESEAADDGEANVVNNETLPARDTALSSAKLASGKFDQRDIIRHVDYLCRKELGGRMTGTPGERKATAYVAAYLDYLGLQPAGDDGTWFQEFEFPDGAVLGDGNHLTIQTDRGSQPQSVELNVDWRPLTFSADANIEDKPIVFAGYGIVAAASEEQEAYDSYAGLDVEGKWVLVFHFVPEDVSPERRQHLQFHSGLRKKSFHARQQGAVGMIVVSGPSSQVRNQLAPLQNDFSPNGSSITAISITDATAARLLGVSAEQLNELQSGLDGGKPVKGFEIENARVSATTEVIQKRGTGRNVIGRLLAGDQPSPDAIIVGAHIDHLGSGKTGSSLAKEEEQGSVHVGADDNASGVAAMLEIAEYLATQTKAGKLKLKRDIIFAAWSGEELGLHGSKSFAAKIRGVGNTKPDRDYDTHDFELAIDSTDGLWLNGQPTTLAELKQSLAFIGKIDPKFPISIQADPDSEVGTLNQLLREIEGNGIEQSPTIINAKVELSVEPDDAAGQTTVVAAVNMDMVGRFKDKLILQGIGSSDYWAGAIERRNAVVGLPLTLSDDVDLPTDASSFYRAGVPILSAFTGSHTDYHTPRDTPEKLNYPDATRIARLMGLITRQLATDDTTPDYKKIEAKPQQASRSGTRAYLGTVPSYGEDVVGVRLEDVTSGAPAALAGVKGGDIIVGLAGQSIENIYDFTAILDGLKIGQPTKIRVLRDGAELELDITPQSRQ